MECVTEMHHHHHHQCWSNDSPLLSLQINAMANKAAGKGYESTDFYENVKFQFVGIENIHVMRQSLQKMIECKYRM